VENFSKWVVENFAQFTGLIAYAFVTALSMFSATVGHFLRRRSVPKARRDEFRASELLLDLTASALVGWVFFWLTVSKGIPPYVTAASVVLVSFSGKQTLMHAARFLRWQVKEFVDTQRKE
jgi:hypothetical protein